MELELFLLLTPKMCLLQSAETFVMTLVSTQAAGNADFTSA